MIAYQMEIIYKEKICHNIFFVRLNHRYAENNVLLCAFSIHVEYIWKDLLLKASSVLTLKYNECMKCENRYKQ